MRGRERDRESKARLHFARIHNIMREIIEVDDPWKCQEIVNLMATKRCVGWGMSRATHVRHP